MSYHFYVPGRAASRWVRLYTRSLLLRATSPSRKAPVLLSTDAVKRVTISKDMSQEISIPQELTESLEAQWERCGEFLQGKLIRQILTRQRVKQLLNYLYDHVETKVTCPISVDEILCDENGKPSYLTVLAILLRLEKADDFFLFKAARIHDWKLFSAEKDDTRCLPKHWKTYEKETFFRYHKAMTVPYLAFDVKTNTAGDYYFLPKQWLPWHDNLETRKQKSFGGFSTVYKIRISAYCHGFGAVLDKVGLDNENFALKILYPKDAEGRDKQEKDYNDERDRLRNFNGMIHENLITVLASYKRGDQYHFVFPWADYNLSEFCMDHCPNPDPRNRRTVHWFASQLKGLAGAMHAIHNPKNIRKYGRHGDLKPANILCFKRPISFDEIWVISDMGLTVINGTRSRSQIPNGMITAGDLTYQAPEIDVKGATVSRAYDVWSMGCIFLEMIVWLVSGFQGQMEFSKARETTHTIDKFIVPNFYEIVTLEKHSHTYLQPDPQPQRYGVKVKTQVFEWYDGIRRSKNSSRFVHDMLDVIQDEMIVVLSLDEKQQRSRSDRIEQRFAEIVHNCTTKGPEYYQKLINEPREDQEHNPVEIVFNQDAENAIRDKNPSFPHYRGVFHRRLSKQDYRKLGDQNHQRSEGEPMDSDHPER